MRFLGLVRAVTKFFAAFAAHWLPTRVLKRTGRERVRSNARREFER